MDYPFQNLVFKGGGIKGLAYLGMIEVLDEKGILKNIQQTAGASAGAITATLVAMADSYEEINEMMSSLDFSKIKDKGPFGAEYLALKEVQKLLDEDFQDILCVWRLVKKYGWYTSDYFYRWIKHTIELKYYGLEKDLDQSATRSVTFKMFNAKFGKKLTVVGTDMTQMDSCVFSEAITPDVEVATAVRISMSIPLFFESIPFEYTGETVKDIFSDGGVIRNYPITIFDEQGIVNPKTLGGRLYTPKSRQKIKPIANVIGYIENLFETLLSVQDQMFDLGDEADKRRSINIDDMGISATKFDLSPEEQDALRASGKTATQNYLESYKAP